MVNGAAAASWHVRMWVSPRSEDVPIGIRSTPKRVMSATCARSADGIAPMRRASDASHVVDPTSRWWVRFARMGATFSDRLSQLGYVKARRLLVLVGVLVLGVVAVTMYARRVDTVEVVATLLFLPIFLAFVYRGVVGGVVAALVATGIYTALRYPAIDAIGADEYTGLIVSRAAAYLIFGAVGGWAMSVLEGSLEKLELYDEIDDETGLYNAAPPAPADRPRDGARARATRPCSPPWRSTSRRHR